MKLFLFNLFFFFSLACSSTAVKDYPDHWWKEVPKTELKWWEISPHSVERGKEVVLSKRNELGVLSNFSYAPFAFREKEYLNLEALWQSMKYPEDKKDPRYKLAKWPHTREEVERMDGFAAKKAGSFASKVMKANNINWVSYNGERMTYRTERKGKHYRFILEAMKEKLDQNQKVRDILHATGKLVLKADHKVKPTDPPAWKYYQIWMELREEL